MHLAEKILLMQPLTFGGDYRWTGTYEQIAPLLQHKFTDLLQNLHSSIGHTEIGERLVTAASELCSPTAELRGHPLTRARGGNPYSLERYISLFDILAKKAEIEARQ